MPRPRRILFKLSGEMLAAPDSSGLDPSRLEWLAHQISEARPANVEIALVLGAGNFVRGEGLSASGIERTTADHMGMAATVVNSAALAGMLLAFGVPAVVLSAVPASPGLAQPYERNAARAAMADGAVAVLAGGTGNPYFTTDTAAALRAVEIGADLLAKGTKVDGVYDKDPLEHADARVFGRVTYDQVLVQRFAVMDATAVALCRDNALPVRVFGLSAPGSIARIARGENAGTLMA